MKNKSYTHLTQEQRYEIAAFLQAGISNTEIAKAIGVNRSTVYRELNRNTPSRGKGAGHYNAINAQRKTERRHKKKNKSIKLCNDLKQEIAYMLTKLKYSPFLIAYELRKRAIKSVCHETIYKWIWEMKKSNKAEDNKYKKLYTHLKNAKRRRKRGNLKDSRGIIPNRVCITSRPQIANDCNLIGDYEVDLVMGENHKSCLLVLLDRKSRKTFIRKCTSKNSTGISNKIIKVLKKVKKVHTLTFDNDMAFAQHEKIAKNLNAKTYFTRPYTSQDKGSIENRNGQIRRFFPKKTDFNQVTHSQVKRVETLLNDRPLKIFNLLTPNDVFLS